MNAGIPVAPSGLPSGLVRLPWGLRPRLHADIPSGLLVALLFLLVPTTMAEDNVRLQCSPRTFQVVPGEPMQLRLTVRADSAVPFRLHIPHHPLLKLRAIEKLPVRLTREGTVLYERKVTWQALEPGAFKIRNLSIETRRQKLMFPEVTITVRDPTP